MYRLQFPRFGSRSRSCKTWLWLAVLSACGPGDRPQPSLPSPGLQVDHGIDLANKTIRLGVLNDESGPAATIGRPYAVGKRMLAVSTQTRLLTSGGIGATTPTRTRRIVVAVQVAIAEALFPCVNWAVAT